MKLCPCSVLIVHQGKNLAHTRYRIFSEPSKLIRKNWKHCHVYLSVQHIEQEEGNF